MNSVATADVGLIGLAVMGENLALNIADHGFKVAVFNRTQKVMQSFIDRNPSTPGGLVGCAKLHDFVAALKRPRKVIILVKAGRAVDAVIQELLQSGIETEDIIIDCGNSLWTDTIRREKQYSGQCRFLGSGVSGGELGARFGPSLMPGGEFNAWKHIEPIWNSIAAKVDVKTGKPIENSQPGNPVNEGFPCTTYIGENGAGHYVKMVHNAIEYVDMQLISEAYFLLKQSLNLKSIELSEIFSEWNKGDLDSYLIQITSDILAQSDPFNPEEFLVDHILDSAQQKGTGKWTSINALDMGMPVNSIVEAVFARYLSSLKNERVEASKHLQGPTYSYQGNRNELVRAVREALHCSKICAYAQGFQLMRQAQVEYHWQLDFAAIANIWRGGCIIRARFLQKISEAFTRDAKLVNLMLDPYFNEQIKQGQTSWRTVISLAAQSGIAAPAFMSALAYYDGYRSELLPANLLQGQRDYFGAHTYERIDKPRETFFHMDWPSASREQITIDSD